MIERHFRAMASDTSVFCDGRFAQVRMLESNGRALVEEAEYTAWYSAHYTDITSTGWQGS